MSARHLDRPPSYAAVVRTTDGTPATRVHRDRSGRWWAWSIYAPDNTVRRSHSGYLTRQAAEVMLAKAIEGDRRE